MYSLCQRYDVCGKTGATVGCNTKGCKSNLVTTSCVRAALGSTSEINKILRRKKAKLIDTYLPPFRSPDEAKSWKIEEHPWNITHLKSILILSFVYIQLCMLTGYARESNLVNFRLSEMKLYIFVGCFGDREIIIRAIWSTR